MGAGYPGRGYRTKTAKARAPIGGFQTSSGGALVVQPAVDIRKAKPGGNFPASEAFKREMERALDHRSESGISDAKRTPRRDSAWAAFKPKAHPLLHALNLASKATKLWSDLPEGNQVALHGWTIVNTCSTGPTHQRSQLATYTTPGVCYTASADSSPSAIGAPVTDPNHNTIDHTRQYEVGSGFRYVMVRRFQKPFDGVVTKSPDLYPRLHNLAKQVHVMIDGFSAPIGQTMPVPLPVPWAALPHWQPNPHRSPTERTHKGPKPETRTRTKNATRLKALLLLTHRLAPPGRAVKEKKFFYAIHSASLLGQVLGLVTESMDATYALWDAMDESIRCGWRRPPPHVAANLIYEHWDKIDYEKALRNIIENEIEDRVIGKAGQLAGKASRNFGFAFGIQVGPAL